MPGVEAGLAEQGRLLVAGDARSPGCRPAGRSRRPSRRSGRSTAAPRAGTTWARRTARTARRTRRASDVVEQRAAGVRRVGEVRPAGEVPEHPRVDGAEGEVGAGLDAALGQQPRQLGGREVRVEHEAGGAGAPGRWPAARSSSQRSAVRRSCHTMARCSGRPVRRSQTTVVSRWLVMPTAATGWSRRGRQLAEGRDHRVPDVVGVVLDPAGAGEVLGELPVGPARPAPRPRRRPRPARRSCRRRWRRRLRKPFTDLSPWGFLSHVHRTRHPHHHHPAHPPAHLGTS